MNELPHNMLMSKLTFGICEKIIMRQNYLYVNGYIAGSLFLESYLSLFP